MLPCPTLKTRKEFAALRRYKRVQTSAFTLRAMKRHPSAFPIKGMRVGITVHKEFGTAASRNRARRRLRAALRGALTKQYLSHDVDLVFILNIPVLKIPFKQLIHDVSSAMTSLDHKSKFWQPQPVAEFDTSGHKATETPNTLAFI